MRHHMRHHMRLNMRHHIHEAEQEASNEAESQEAEHLQRHQNSANWPVLQPIDTAVYKCTTHTFQPLLGDA